MIEVDARGYSCPEPVIRLKRVIAEHNEIDLLVDNKISAEVCSRFARSKGFSVNVHCEDKREEKIYILELRK